MIMNLKITQVQTATNQEWDEIWENCDYATYFHSREWAETWQHYTQGKLQPEPKLVKFSDGQQALLPLSSQKVLKGLIRSYVSSPAGTFGGWLSRDDLSINHTNLISRFLIDLGDIQWRLNPYSTLSDKVLGGNLKQDVTDVIDLQIGFDLLCKKWHKNSSSLLRKIRKATREGVSIKIASSLEEWQTYYKIYQSSLERWGGKETSKYEWYLFDLMFQLHSPNIKLWLAVYQDHIISGALCFYSKIHVVYWHGAALSEHFDLRPVNLLMYEIIKHSCQESYHWFDFNPSGGHEGVKAFKKSFGTQELACPMVASGFLRKIKNTVLRQK